MTKQLDRRSLLRAGAGLGAGAALAACTPPWHDPILDRTLPREHGDFAGYRGMAETPWLRQSDDGRLHLTPDTWAELPWGVDFHAHLGMSFLFSPPVDLQHEAEQTLYLMDCDAHDDCRMAMDDYLNKIATPAMLAQMEKRLTGQAWFGGSAAARTHTIPNLIREMDAMKIRHAVLLAVAPRLPFRNNPTEAWLEGVQASPHRDRLIVFAGLHATDSSAAARLGGFVERGCKGVKLHPTMQQFYPNDPAAMRFYRVCARLGVPVFFHAGRAGIEPKSSRRFAEMQHYEAPARANPDVNFVFGHAGARDWEAAMALAARYPNIHLEIEGQGVGELKQILKRVPPEQIVFGSDWPFFPLAATVARVMMATEDQPEIRPLIFAENARRILGLG